MKLFLLIAAIAAAQDQTGGVSGIVRDSVSHQPLKKAMVTLNPLQYNGGQGQNSGPKSATTDVSGTFSIDNLPAGQYQLTVQHQNYPQTRNGAVHKSVTINAGEKAGPIEVELIPPGSISGRVLDEDGDPLTGCTVQAHPAAHPEQGAQSSGFRGTEEEGEYRLYGIPPGKYILSVQCNQAAFQPRLFSAGPDPPPTLAYPMQYYPLATEAKSAQVIELAAGSERSGVDFRMRPTAVTTVVGAFSPPGSGGTNLQTRLLPADWKPGNLMFFPQPRPNATGDSVTFLRVFPGSYVLLAFKLGQEGNSAAAFRRIEVKDQPVETVIEMRPGISIAGTVEIVGNGSTKFTPNQIHVFLRATYPFGLQQSEAQVADDGTFTLKSVVPIPWRLQLGGVQGAFLKSAMFGSTELTDQTIDLSSGAAEPLKLVFSTNVSSIRGNAPVGSMVWAEQVDASAFAGTTAAQVDPSGQFNFPSLAPGKYRVAIGDQGGMPDEGGSEVTVHEGETVNVDVKAPAQ